MAIDKKRIKRLIFDADDTLWENNIYYVKAAEDLVDLIHQTGLPKVQVELEFQKIERQAVKERGYGSVNYLYILNTLFAKHRDKLSDQTSQKRFDLICSQFARHVEIEPKLFPQVGEILETARRYFNLYVLTKGDIPEQKKKLENSKLLPFFDQAFVVAEKDLDTYRRILKENDWIPGETCMIGNSPKSDINPSLQLGLYAIYIPYEHTWVLDDEPIRQDQKKLTIIESIADLKFLFS